MQTIKAVLSMGRGKLVIGGETVAQVPRQTIELDLDAEALASILAGGTYKEGEEVNDRTATTAEGQTSLVNPDATGGLGVRGKGTQSDRTSTEDIDRVADHYLQVMPVRSQKLGDDDRAIIRGALKVASVEECIRCIDTCEQSDYHMKRGKYEHRSGRKYNGLGSILKPRTRRGETVRSRIDFWLDRADETALGIADVPSADKAIVMQKVADVRAAQRVPDDEEAQERGRQAQAWLSQHGIKTVRDADGFPRFQRGPAEGAAA
jgi:hypothetical protein